MFRHLFRDLCAFSFLRDPRWTAAVQLQGPVPSLPEEASSVLKDHFTFAITDLRTGIASIESKASTLFSWSAGVAALIAYSDRNSANSCWALLAIIACNSLAAACCLVATWPRTAPASTDSATYLTTVVDALARQSEHEITSLRRQDPVIHFHMIAGLEVINLHKAAWLKLGYCFSFLGVLAAVGWAAG